jgi:hypothetical protein
MRNLSLRRPAQGDKLLAADQVALVREVERFARMNAGDGMYQGAGTIAADVAPRAQEARIVSGPDGQGRFAWRGVRFNPDGTYTDLDAGTSDRALSDPAYERNSVKAITPGTRVLLVRHPQSDTWRFDAPPLMLVGKTGGSGVPAMTGSTPGSGTVTLYTYNGATLTATSQTVQAKNEASTAAGANKFVQMKIGPGGYPFLDFEDCP